MSMAKNIDTSTVTYTHKNECLKMIKVLNHNLKNMEKEQKSLICNKKTEKDFEPIYEIYITNDSNLKKDKTKLGQKFYQISQLIGKFKQETRVLKQTDNFIETLKVLMEQIDTTISNSKEEFLKNLEDFSNEEKLLTKEIEIYEKKIQNWQTNKNENENQTNTKIVNPLSDKYTGSELLKEVIDFDKFLLNNGGHNGGWDEIDQNLFLKIRNKHKGKVGFIDELESLIGTKTRQQIEQHEEWYKNYLNLNELKKQAIKDWKDKKQAAKNEVVSLVDEELNLNKEIEKQLKNRFEKKRLIEKQERNKKLNQWRIEREIQKAKELEKQRKEEELRIEKEIQKRKEQEELREQVMEYKRQKEELNEYIEMEKYLMKQAESEIKSKNANMIIANFQTRDLTQLKEKQARLKAKQEEAELKLKRLENTKERVEINYDPNRLYQMTNAWKARVNTPRSDSCGPVITPRIPHLAVPSWRQGV